MMVVPVDPDDHETQDVDEQLREPAAQVGEAAAGRCPQSERHDSDDHCEHAVAEGLQPAGLGLGVTKHHRHSLTAANDSTPGSAIRWRYPRSECSRCPGPPPSTKPSVPGECIALLRAFLTIGWLQPQTALMTNGSPPKVPATGSWPQCEMNRNHARTAQRRTLPRRRLISRRLRKSRNSKNRWWLPTSISKAMSCTPPGKRVPAAAGRSSLE